MRVIWLPLEPFEWRYTQQWYEIFPREFHKLGIEYKQVDGQKLTDRIELGSVLDAYGTNFWKSIQLATLIKLMREGEVTSEDTLLFADLWYPGIEALKYISCLGGQKPKITGILHAGTWDENDFLVRYGLRPFFHEIESAWFEIYDLIFVATTYHKNLILKSYHVDPNKIVVTGLPFYPDELNKYRKSEKQPIIVFPHRLDPEKCPDEFLDLKKNFPEMECLRTYDICQTKDDYYNVLSKATIAVSLALQETFGIAMLEATALGCIPLVPDRLSYTELYPDELRYSTYQELIHKIETILEQPTYFQKLSEGVRHYHETYLVGSIRRMIQAVEQVVSEGKLNAPLT